MRVSFAALGLILVQAALGGLTVEEGSKQELVATHLGVAMLQIGLVLLMGRLGGSRRAAPSLQPGGTRAIRAVTGLALVAVLGTIVAGGYMSASELHGTGVEHRSVDAHMACGDEFPACGGEFLPFGRSEALDIHLTHRAFMYVAVVVVLALFAIVVRQRRRLDERWGAELVNLAWVTVVILFAQVLLGALNVWAGEHAWLIVAHLAVGTLLWLSLDPVRVHAHRRCRRPRRRGLARAPRHRPRRRRPDGSRSTRTARLPSPDGARWHGSTSAREAIAPWVALTKPRVISLLLVTTAATMFVADSVARRSACCSPRSSAATSPPAARARSTTSSSATSTHA